MDAVRAAYDEVHAHTMGRLGFILQHVVDPFAAQTANAGSKPISVVFGLVGLYLQVERQFPAVRSRRHTWTRTWKTSVATRVFARGSGSMTVADARAAPAGPERDAAIDDWCRSVWTAFGGNRQTIIALLRGYPISGS